MTNFSGRFQYLKNTNGLTQTEIANKLNTTQQTIGRWLNGNCEPDINSLIVLADLFGCSVDYLLGRENEEGAIYVMNNSKATNELLNNISSLHADDQKLISKLVDSILLSYTVKK